MPTITKTFAYTGTTQQATIPAGAASVTFHIWGGGGGGGGGDSAGPGRPGACGHYVTGTIDLTAESGSTMTLGVGGGAGGKSMGKGLTGYSGGNGGTQGPTGSSGAGGGGGAATVIKINGTDIAVAGGGGGGGGDGQNSVGTDGINNNDPTLGVPGTLGENGANHSGDGAGAGAGGGGTDGGRSGNGAGGDDGGTGGYSGSNLVPTGGTGSNGTGVSPFTGASYQAGAATGGSAASPGGNGLAVLIFDISVEAKSKVNNAWKTISAIKFKKSGTWKDISAAYVKINGVWKAIFNSGVNFVPTTAGFGDSDGNPSSGTPGSGGLPPSGGGGGGGCSIICTKLHELGYLSDEIYQADEMFGHWLRQTDPNAYYGYLKWARVVVDWMSNEGPQCMFWIQDRAERNAQQKAMAVRWARRIATPWAEHMAYKMGVLKEDNRAGRYIMTIGIAVSRIIGKFVKHTNQPTKNVAIGYAMWAMFGLLYMIAGVK